MSTIRPTSAKTVPVEFQTSPSRFSGLSKKTDAKARQKLEQPAPIFNKNKRAFDADFPPSSDAASTTSKIAEIAFPVSPTSSPTKGSSKKIGLLFVSKDHLPSLHSLLIREVYLLTRMLL